jgi:effector-binding domain-containing protein
MIEAPTIVTTTPQNTAKIHLIVSWDDIKTVMGPTIQEVYQAIGAQGVAPEGPWFTHHLRRPTDTFDFEASVPVASPIQPAGRVQPGQWPSMKVVRTVYHGGYDALGEAWGEFIGWIEEQSIRTADDLWEVYLVGPDAPDDASTYCMQLNRQLLS